MSCRRRLFFFFFNDTATTEIYPLSLHDALPISDAVGQAVAGGTVVAVAGTHGKTTTTVMVTEALAAAGRNPTGLAGGRVAPWGGNARIGGGELFVVEADEFDRAFLSLAPTVAVLNNVEADHLECYGGRIAA